MPTTRSTRFGVLVRRALGVLSFMEFRDAVDLVRHFLPKILFAKVHRLYVFSIRKASQLHTSPVNRTGDSMCQLESIEKHKR